jgi:hypothetical protein
MKCPGKAKYAVMRRLFLLVRGRSRDALRRVHAKLRKGNTVKGRSLRKLRPYERNKKRLHDQCIDRRRADQPLPVSLSPRNGMVSPDAHQRRTYTNWNIKLKP